MVLISVSVYLSLALSNFSSYQVRSCLHDGGCFKLRVLRICRDIIRVERLLGDSLGLRHDILLMKTYLQRLRVATQTEHVHSASYDRITGRGITTMDDGKFMCSTSRCDEHSLTNNITANATSTWCQWSLKLGSVSLYQARLSCE